MTMPAFVPPTASPQVAVDRRRTLDLLQDHRRVQNCRSCTGCSWRPSRAGRNGDPDTMRERHAEFNAHLAALIHPGEA